MESQIEKSARDLCEKFINKVEKGHARSVETYAECKNLLELIHHKNDRMQECKILDDKPAVIQKTINQWRHQYELCILNMCASANGIIVILTRTEK
jgi:hypothetical protein